MPKKLPQIITLIFLIIFLLQIGALLFLFLMPQNSLASGSSGSWEEPENLQFTPQVPIPGQDVSHTFTKNDNTAPIAKYIIAIYKYGIGIVGILAAVVLMWGGVVWLTAGGNASRVEDAKAWISGALTGLVLALGSYTILYTINPDLVNFRTTTINSISTNEKTTGCCQVFSYESGGKKEYTCSMVNNETECSAGKGKKGKYKYNQFFFYPAPIMCGTKGNDKGKCVNLNL